MTSTEPTDIEVRLISGASSLTRDRDQNVLVASGAEASVLLACARHVARLPVDLAMRWWRGESQTGEFELAPTPDGEIALRTDGVTARVSLDLLRWAIEGAYAEHLGDFTRWMFSAPQQACIAGEGDRQAAASLEPSVAKLAAEVAAKTLPPASEAARRASLIAQVGAFALLSEPMLAEKRDALLAFGCPALARWSEAARALTAYYASPERAQVAPPSLGAPSVTGGVLSLDFPGAAVPPNGVERHRWWAFCEAQVVIAQRSGLPDAPGFLFASSGPLRAKLFYRSEDGRRQALYAAQAR